MRISLPVLLGVVAIAVGGCYRQETPSTTSTRQTSPRPQVTPTAAATRRPSRSRQARKTDWGVSSKVFLQSLPQAKALDTGGAFDQVTFTMMDAAAGIPARLLFFFQGDRLIGNHLRMEPDDRSWTSSQTLFKLLADGLRQQHGAPAFFNPNAPTGASARWETPTSIISLAQEQGPEGWDVHVTFRDRASPAEVVQDFVDRYEATQLRDQ